MKSTKTIWVKSVDRISPQGRHKQVYTVKNGNELVPIKTMNKNREFGTATELQFHEDSERMKLDTGFDQLVDNPWFEFEPIDIKSKYGLSSKWDDILPNIVKSKKITKQVYLEIRHSVDPDFYTSNLKWTFTKLPRNLDLLDDVPYLKTLKCILYPNYPNEFSNDSPRQELLMEMMYRNNQIAKSKAEINSAIHSFYISNENFEESEKLERNDKIEEATYHLFKLKKEASSFATYQIASLLTNRDNQPIIKGEVSDKVLKNTLSDYIQGKSSSQLDNINKFLDIVELTTTVEGKERLNVMYLIQQAINNRVMGIRDGMYVWFSKVEIPNLYQISNNYDKVVSFFLKEYQNYSPKSDVTNWYAELLEEVKRTDAKFE